MQAEVNGGGGGLEIMPEVDELLLYGCTAIHQQQDRVLDRHDAKAVCLPWRSTCLFSYGLVDEEQNVTWFHEKLRE